MASCEKATEIPGSNASSTSNSHRAKSGAALELKIAAERKERLNEIADQPDASKADAADYAHSLVALDEAIKKAKEVGVEDVDGIVRKAWSDSYDRMRKRHEEQRKRDQELREEQKKREAERIAFSDKKRRVVSTFSEVAVCARQLSVQKGEAAERALSFIRMASISCTTDDEFSEAIRLAKQKLINAGVMRDDSPSASDPSEPEPLYLDQ